MKKTTTSKFGLLMAMVAILISSCSTNATFSKRYHSRGFNIAWGGGSAANNNPVKQTPKKVKAKSDVVAQNTENVIVQSVNSTENAVLEASTVSTAVVSNNILVKLYENLHRYYSMEDININEILENAKRDPSLFSTLDIDALLESIENDKNDYLENKTMADVTNTIFEMVNSMDLSIIEKANISADFLFKVS
jgi:hypothetical protein